MKHKSLAKKYGSSLRSAPHTTQGDLLIEGKDKRLKKISPLDVKYQGTTYKMTLDLYHDLQTQHSDLKHHVGSVSGTLISILKQKGYNTPNVDIKSLVDDILRLNIIEPTKQYTGFQIKDGYVVGKGYDAIFEMKELPDDIYNGYWKSDKRGNITLDEVKYSQYWSVV